MENKMHPLQHHLSAIDLLPLGVIVGAWFDVFPSIAALFAVGWYSILIWESDTVRGWTDREQITIEHDDNPDDMTGQ